jgi:hypothetical protein
MLLDKFQYLLGDTGVGADVAAIHLPLAQLFHLCILGWHDANGDLRRLAEVRPIECNRRNRPTPQSLPGAFLRRRLRNRSSIVLLPQRRFRQESRPLLDHLVGAGEERWRHGEAEHSCCLSVKHRFELGGLYDRQVGWRRSLEIRPV